MVLNVKLQSMSFIDNQKDGARVNIKLMFVN